MTDPLTADAICAIERACRENDYIPPREALALCEMAKQSIDAEAAIAKLKEEVHDLVVESGHDLANMRRIRRERDEAIAKATAWISCKDRMPDHGQHCIAHSPAQNGYKAATWMAVYWTDEDPRWWLTGAEQKVEITLWMPLPPLPPGPTT